MKKLKKFNDYVKYIQTQLGWKPGIRKASDADRWK